jgi:hypothetical protein
MQVFSRCQNDIKQSKYQQQMWQAGPWQLRQGHLQSHIWWAASAGAKENITDNLPMGSL